MSRIDELIHELCPDGVRHVVLSEIADYSSTRVEAADLDETTFVGVDNLVAEKGGRVDASYPPNTARLTAYEPGDILLGNIRPYLKKVWRATNDGGCSGDVLAIRIKGENRAEVNSEFLYYLLSSDIFFAYNMQHAKGAKMPRGNKAAILNYRIPVPPLEVQREIVAVLDKFTQLEAELEAELEARRAQYDHYMSQIVGESQTGEKDSLGDLEKSGAVKLGRGKVISKVALEAEPGNYPVYSSSGSGTGEFGRYGQYMFDDERITWSVDGGGRFFYRVPHRYSVTNVSGWMQVDTSRFLVRYLYYVLTVLWGREKFDYTRKAHPSVIREVYMIAEPSLEVQAEVVGQLDRFDALVNDISVGLPAALTARRQQYEYYRDRLLALKEPAA